MVHEFRCQRRVRFADTDCAGIVHFANYFRYLEEAEHDFLRSLGTSVRIPAEGGEVGFPRLAAACEYLRPARFDDLLDIHLRVERKGKTSITYAAVLSRDGEPVARARWTAVACLVRPDGTFHPVPLPEPLAGKVEAAPGPPLELRA